MVDGAKAKLLPVTVNVFTSATGADGDGATGAGALFVGTIGFGTTRTDGSTATGTLTSELGAVLPERIFVMSNAAPTTTAMMTTYVMMAFCIWNTKSDQFVVPDDIADCICIGIARS